MCMHTTTTGFENIFLHFLRAHAKATRCAARPTLHRSHLSAHMPRAQLFASIVIERNF